MDLRRIARDVSRFLSGAPECITATRLVLALAEQEETGGPGEPVPVRMRMYNPYAWEHELNRTPPAFVDSSRGYVIDVGSGSYTVDSSGWDGHLVARFGDTVVDASLPALSRPERGMVFRPGSFLLARGDLREGIILTLPSGAGVLMHEEDTPHSESFRETRAWTSPLPAM